NAIDNAATEPGVTKEAITRPDGGTELSTSITLADFLDRGIISFPDKLLEVVDESMRDERIPATVTFTPDGDFERVAMNATIVGDGHEAEVHVTFEVVGSPSTA